MNRPTNRPTGHDVILALNAGSSSLKFVVFAAQDGDSALAEGLVDRIGSDAASIRLRDGAGADLPVAEGRPADHAAALQLALDSLSAALPDARVVAVGHRVVHGGTTFRGPVIVDEPVMAQIEALRPFAPLHQPHNIAGIRAAMAAFPGVPQIACFDTAFHRTHPWVNDTFALPSSFYDEGVRRYGFHGLSYDYITSELHRIAPLIAAGRVVIAHLGNGASMCAVQNGRSVASTMGFTALDGLPMGTRSGQLDPGVVLYLMDQRGMTTAEVRRLLYEKSGLLGLSGGLSNDMRTLESAATPEAQQAIDYFVFRIQRELGAMAAAMGGIDALVFCGGIGENSRLIRARVCERTEWMGLEIDHGRNDRNETIISSDVSRGHVMVIPTNEGLVIARAARDLLNLGGSTT
ncbi:MAG: acetate/propionate family kinase [Paracoccus sp. (in: a-proteobacteria)]|uniref:acetate/propionate family kinase n=1 Tax=Paracoccus sp. TaxID=267 RepID=UPI0026DFC4EA|nr:acetate/propionate family kinase [Paracoccus sp. (in: a-proteobacteria)]MDO5612672.1 acetate/propionate family kinase [Paracoccus sp. (in: a-proteobacteria)]